MVDGSTSHAILLWFSLFCELVDCKHSIYSVHKANTYPFLWYFQHFALILKISTISINLILWTSKIHCHCFRCLLCSQDPLKIQQAPNSARRTFIKQFFVISSIWFHLNKFFFFNFETYVTQNYISTNLLFHLIEICKHHIYVCFERWWPSSSETLG